MTCKLYYCYGPVSFIIVTCLLLNWLISSDLVNSPSSVELQTNLRKD